MWFLPALAIELEKRYVTDEEDYKAIVQHLCASRQNWKTGVLTLVTDLNDFWCFFWFGRRHRIFKRRTNASQTKFLLLFNSEAARDCPEGFSSRVSWDDCFPSNPMQRCFGCLVDAKEIILAHHLK
jgi:hypothetical protein